MPLLPRPILIEICVDDAAGIHAAIVGGADRIELCSALPLGGLTPSAGLMQLAARLPIPTFAMIRPRAGDFVFGPDNIAQMAHDITLARSFGLAGVVLGASTADGALDAPTLAYLIQHATGMGLTLHRAFDLTPDMPAAIDLAINLGFDRILTSGGAATAPQGVATLEKLFHYAAGRISLMPGAGISAQTIGALRHLPLTEIHGSCASSHPTTGRATDFGFTPNLMRYTDPLRIRALRAALAD